MPVLEQIVYGSVATGRTDSLLNAATILAESQRNNGRDGLTGALAAHEGHYIQVLEGPPGALDGLLRRLALDPRHRDIEIYGRTPIAARRFDGWSMANARITPALAPVLSRVMAETPRSPERLVALLTEAVAAD
ncbi:BLUF domain-containing protein [uncultured Brevundimonas sp.]|uniref:BLUF domain-containing protein n=1 Tax=uncultured Brevundimonas sp. TaxID=213418 RepID=UPI0030EDE399